MPHHVLPIASGLCRRRRHIKKKQQSYRRRRTKAIIRALNSHRFEDSIAGQDRLIKQGNCWRITLIKASLCSSCCHLLSSFQLLHQPLCSNSCSRPSDESLPAGVPLDSLLSDLPVWKEGGPSWEIEFLDPAKNSGISTATNAGSPGAPVCQPMSGTLTEAKSAGTNKHLSEAVCHTKSACQGLDGRKNSRDEPVAVEEGRGPKRQRTTGALDEVSPLSIVEAGEGVGWPAGAVVNLGARPSVSFLGEQTVRR